MSKLQASTLPMTTQVADVKQPPSLDRYDSDLAPNLVRFPSFHTHLGPSPRASPSQPENAVRASPESFPSVEEEGPNETDTDAIPSVYGASYEDVEHHIHARLDRW